MNRGSISVAEAAKSLMQMARRIKEDAQMNDKEKEIVGRDMIRVYDSLLQAVHNAGGTGFDAMTIESMPVLQLLTILAPNKVRFYCSKTHELTRILKPTVDPRQCKDEK